MDEVFDIDNIQKLLTNEDAANVADILDNILLFLSEKCGQHPDLANTIN